MTSPTSMPAFCAGLSVLGIEGRPPSRRRSASGQPRARRWPCTSLIDTPTTARRDLAELDQVVHHLLRERDRNREAVAGVVARPAGDRAVDADDFAADVDQRAARVARVDRRVGLDEVGDRVVGCCGRRGLSSADLIAALALTMPAVTVKSRPSGLPIASTHSPTRAFGVIAERERRQVLARRS